MARAALDDGQEVLALNEIFVGHATHQSARYTIALGERARAPELLGVIAATGTGATGWAASINRQLAAPLALPPRPTRPWRSSARGVAEQRHRTTSPRAASRRPPALIDDELGEAGPCSATASRPITWPSTGASGSRSERRAALRLVG